MTIPFKTVLVFNLLVLFLGLTPIHGFLATSFRRLNQPLETQAYLINSRLLDKINFLLTLPKIYQENTNLKSEVLVLQENQGKYLRQERELEILRGQLKISNSAKKSRLLLAQVLNQNISEGVLELSLGQEDGVKVGNLVTINGVLVGKVFQVSPTRARVLMTVSPESHIEAATASLVARGEAVGNFGSQIIFTKVLPSQNLSVGETVVDFAHRLILGRVQEVKENGPKIFKEAVISSAYDPSQITEVFINLDL